MQPSSNTWILAFMLLFAAPILADTGPEKISQEQFEKWAAGSAIAIPDLNWTKHLKDLESLDKYLVGKRIVYLGESDHWVHEKYDYRLFLINYLYQKGWNNIGLEMGGSDGGRVDSYLRTGDSEWLKKVAIYGYQGALRKDRTDVPKGRLKPKSREFPLRFRNEEMWFASQLREINRANDNRHGQFHFFGFDVDTIPGGGYEDLENLLNPYHSSAIVEFRTKIARVSSESVDQEITRLEQAIQFLYARTRDLRNELSEELLSKVEHTLLTLRDSLDFMRVSYSNPPFAELMKAFQKREETMFRESQWILKRLGPDAKVIFMGHDMHLSKSFESLRFAPAGIPHAPVMWPSIGSYLNKNYPGQVYSFWMLHDHGWHSNFDCPDAGCEIRSSAGSVGQILDRVGKIFILPIGEHSRGSAFLNTDLTFPTNGGEYSGNIYQNSDCVFFLSNVNALNYRTSKTEPFKNIEGR
jgi:erythromycin esterase-like protein